MDGVVPATVLALAAVSVKEPAVVVMEIAAVPSAVNVAVRVRPLLSFKAPNVPPATTTSPVVPSQAKVAPGSSLNVKVIVVVPSKTIDVVVTPELAAVIVTVGAKVSMACALSVLAALTLPAASVIALAARARETEPLATPAVGVTFTTQAVPLPVMVLIVPLVTVKSPASSPVTDSLKV